MDERETAVALRYRPDEDDLPRLSAKGRGPVARQIVAVAEAHGVAVRRDVELVQLLDALDVDSPIPLAAFAAVAEILAHLYRRNRAGEAAASP